jgi:hypothetical protein
VDGVPVLHIANGPQVFHTIIYKVIVFTFVKLFVEPLLGLHISLIEVRTRTPDLDLVTDGQSDRPNPIVWRIRKERHGPSLEDHIVNDLGISLEGCSLENFGQMGHKAFVVDLFIKIGSVYAKILLKTAGSMTVSQN